MLGQTENSLQKFRDNTHKDTNCYSWTTKVCPGCKKTRSKGQFEGKINCKSCRGVR